jgi:hypothetical protein
MKKHEKSSTPLILAAQNIFPLKRITNKYIINIDL